MSTRDRPELFFRQENQSSEERLPVLRRLEEEESKQEDRKYEQETSFLL